MWMPEMRDLCPLLTFLAAGYGAALLGCAVAHLSRISFRQGGKRRLTLTEASACSLLPFVALVGFFCLSGIDKFAGVLLLDDLHNEWHQWADLLHQIPAVHGSLHILNVALLLGAVCTLTRAVYVVARIHTFATMISGVANQKRIMSGHEVHILPIEGFHCFTVGVLRPRIYVSGSLLTELSSRETDVMLAHEAGHVRRRDGIVVLILSALLNLIPLPGGLSLLDEWISASERACDEEASRVIGNRCDVAATLVKVAQLIHRQSLSSADIPAVCFVPRTVNANELEERVGTLLMDAREIKPTTRTLSLVACVFAIILVTALYPCLIHLAEMFTYH
jgi:Zn-dependent protease with chaperone function